MNNRKFIVLVNPISGTKNKRAIIDYVEKKLTSLKFFFETHTTNAIGVYNWLLEKIESEKITDIIIVGGDGTVNTILQTVRTTKIRVGIIPSGSGNGLALTAGIKRDYKKALDVILKGKAEYIDVFECNGKFACMLCGIGFDAQVAHDFAKQKKRGLFNYTKQSVKNFITAKPKKFELIIDDKKINTEAFFISIANSNQFGNNFTIAPKASLSDGLLDIVIVQKMSKLKLPLAILQQLRGRNKFSKLTESLTNNNIVYFQTANITIINKEKAPLHIDGEAVATFKQLEFKVHKKSVQLLMP